jgi:hypothetical protein
LSEIDGERLKGESEGRGRRRRRKDRRGDRGAEAKDTGESEGGERIQ